MEDFSAPFSVSSLLHSGYNHPVIRKWQGAGGITKSSLIYPVFIQDVPGISEIPSLPGIHRYVHYFIGRYGLDTIVKSFTPLVEKGLKCVLIFGVPTKAIKDDAGFCADGPESIVIKAIKVFKESFPNLLIACDVCLCAYTSHGHCGILGKNGLDNQASIERLAEVSLAFVRAGCKLICPSDMMDGRILAIKTILLKAGYGSEVCVMSYSAKFASVFYGPFRYLVH